MTSHASFHMFEVGPESPSYAIEKVPSDVLTLLFGSYRLIRWILPLFPTVDATRAAEFLSREAEAAFETLSLPSEPAWHRPSQNFPPLRGVTRGAAFDDEEGVVVI